MLCLLLLPFKLCYQIDSEIKDNFFYLYNLIDYNYSKYDDFQLSFSAMETLSAQLPSRMRHVTTAHIYKIAMKYLFINQMKYAII